MPLWPQGWFGTTLLRCSDLTPVPVSEIVPRSSVLGVYFAFAGISDSFSAELRCLYGTLREKGVGFEVVQVVLWTQGDQPVEEGFEASLSKAPWLAMPLDEVQAKTRLSRMFNIKLGLPSLVLLDSEGNTITAFGAENLAKDPQGSRFPWKPRTADQILQNINLIGPHASSQRFECFKASITGLYFSANWCPPCKAFTPQLVEFYKNIKNIHPDFEIIYVSSDRSLESFESYTESMPWLAIPWKEEEARSELAQLYNVRGIPTLLLLDENGHVVTSEARNDVTDDPTGKNFPWRPRSFNYLTDKHLDKLHYSPALILFTEKDEAEMHFAESIIAPISSIEPKTQQVSTSTTAGDKLQFFIGDIDGDTCDILRQFIRLEAGADFSPLVLLLDLPQQRYAALSANVDICRETVSGFVTDYYAGRLTFCDIDVCNK